MQRIDRIVETVCTSAVLVCGAMLIASAGYVSADLMARKILNLSLVGANEISGYVLAISTSWAFSYTLLKRSHIRIDVFYRYLPPRWRAGIDIVAVATLAGLACVFVFFAQRYFVFVWTNGSRSITSLAMPLWIPMLAWLAGWVVFLFVSLYLTVASAWAFVRHDGAEIQRRVGSIAEDEEVVIEGGLDETPVIGGHLRERS